MPPFSLTPLFAISIYWHLPVLLLVVSFVYSATRHDRWDRIFKEAGGWILRMSGFLGGLGMLLYLLSTYPRLWPYAAGLIGTGMVIYYALGSSWFRKKVGLTQAAPATASTPAVNPNR